VQLHLRSPRSGGGVRPACRQSYRGCGHECRYCYVPTVLKMKRLEFDAGAAPRPEFIKHLTKDARKYQTAGITEQVMLSFTSDPYHPGDTTLTRLTPESFNLPTIVSTANPCWCDSRICSIISFSPGRAPNGFAYSVRTEAAHHASWPSFRPHRARLRRPPGTSGNRRAGCTRTPSVSSTPSPPDLPIRNAGWSKTSKFRTNSVWAKMSLKNWHFL
jgi:hypothetical protein